MKNSNFFGAPSPGGRSVREITSREETERPPENRLGRSQQASASTGSRLPGTESLLYKTESFQRPRVEQHAHSREMRNSNFFGAPPLGVGVFGKLPAARKRKDRQRNRLGRSPQAPACPRNRKPAGDLARQIEPLPSRSGRLLDYESSGSPSPSRSYR